MTPQKKAALLGSRLKDARTEAQLSQQAVAHKMGLHRPTIGYIERGTRGVQALELVVLAKLYGKDPADFLVGL